ncbi:GNAT family N-acetyltransferase [Bacillus sp. AGMB 02131]|uniref:GNAT family N-acetyltransferase n=1 Tax=Peribacillus faecalis TaxID=2772559 RepID=A0A927D092_9BACI|nr:GNAT family N-acetyltransferase [Peribacillus faecalis]MBD3109887.1 GNAT family N-acetyltransferase [Peribacillus faecalis]
MKFIIVQNQQQLEEAYTIRKKVFVEEQNVPMEEEIDEFEMDAVHFLLYSEHDQPIAAGRFREADGYGKVERICVLAEQRRTGAGKYIMESIAAYAEQNGINKLKLNAQTHAIRFYESLGYEVVSEEFMDAGIPHKTMVKTLKA